MTSHDEVASRMLLEKNTGGSLPLDGEDQRARDFQLFANILKA
jgi:hypothetical protein